jgi:hypothetical protein
MGDTHILYQSRIKRLHQALQTLRPVGGRFYNLNQMNKQHQRVVELAFSANSMQRVVTEVIPEIGRFLAGQLEGYCKFAVPETAMVRGGIAQ